MDAADFQKAALFEHRFWLQILGDHGRFIFNGLPVKEEKEIQCAGMFIKIFDSLLERARQPLSDPQLMALTREAYSRAHQIREFKLHLLRRHLTGDISFNLPPTFVNHMLNELEEYMGILSSIMSNRIPSMHPVHHHLLWLLDGSGHAASIDGSLDEVEHDLKEKSREFNRNFKELYMKAVEMAGYMRTGESKFPSLKRFNSQVEFKMDMFKDFLRELEGLVLSKEVLSTLMPLIPDHMFREECYYLTKLSEVSDVKLPDCDPAKPRVME